MPVHNEHKRNVKICRDYLAKPVHGRASELARKYNLSRQMIYHILFWYGVHASKRLQESPRFGYRKHHLDEWNVTVG